MAKESNKVKIWDNYKVIGEVRKSKGKKLVVCATTLNGFRYVVIQEYYRRKVDNEWMRGARMMAIPVLSSKDDGKTWLHPLSEILPVMKEAGDYAATMELEDEANAIWKESK